MRMTENGYTSSPKEFHLASFDRTASQPDCHAGLLEVPVLALVLIQLTPFLGVINILSFGLLHAHECKEAFVPSLEIK